MQRVAFTHKHLIGSKMPRGHDLVEFGKFLVSQRSTNSHCAHIAVGTSAARFPPMYRFLSGERTVVRIYQSIVLVCCHFNIKYSVGHTTDIADADDQERPTILPSV